MKKILIAGGAGFIGSHLCERLLNEGNLVTCLDNFFTSTPKNIERFSQNPHFRLIEHDVQEPIDIEADEIYNLACPASPIHYQHDAIYTTKTGFLGSLNMLELAKKYHAHYLFASTSEVYGDPLEHPQRESYWGHVNPIGCRACYDESKRCSESLTMDFHRQYQIPVKIVRIFNTYGPNMLPNDGRVVSNFIMEALKEESITIYGDGKQTRSFQYIDDLIEGLVRMMASDDSFIGPVNLGNPQEFTIHELADLIAELTQSKLRIVYKPLPLDDPQRRNPDISLAQEKLNGWKPEIHLRDGLIKTIEYFKSLS